MISCNILRALGTQVLNKSQQSPAGVEVTIITMVALTGVTDPGSRSHSVLTSWVALGSIILSHRVIEKLGKRHRKP
jgi:hypothetical protein